MGIKVVILAGGFGTRLAEETVIKPKPMVEIGGRPILWHIMKHYAHYGFKEFVIALGYKGDVIKRYFLDYCAMSSDLTVDLSNGSITKHQSSPDDWKVHLVDTGLHTLTGGRLKRLQSWLGNEPFMMTYGDGVSNIDLKALLEFHRSHNKLVTISAVSPPARFGALAINEHQVTDFAEKPPLGEGLINGGFMVLEPDIFKYIQQGDSTNFEKDVLVPLAADGELMAFEHRHFWRCMDTIRDKRILEELWQQDADAPWKIWE